MRSAIRGSLAAVAAAYFLPVTADAAPLTVAGFTFSGGEEAFADDALVVSGTVTGATDEQVRSTLVGSNLGDSIRVITPDVAVIEVVFSDNAIVNGPGTDLVIFELSGSARPIGYADSAERFEVSVLGGSGFSPFVEVVSVNTGYLAPHDASLSAYVVQVDLATFGFSTGDITDRVQIRLVDHLVTRSADPTALGALNSTPVPEPSTALLMALGLMGLATARSRRSMRMTVWMTTLAPVGLAGSAAADATVDLLWHGVSGAPTNVLTVEPGDPGALQSGLSCGPVVLGEGQRCLLVLLSITAPSDEFSIELTFDDTQLSGDQIAMLPLPFPWNTDPVATGSTPTFGAGVAGPFRATTSLGDAPPGNYAVGAVVFATSGITASTTIVSRAFGNGVLGDGAGDLQPTSFGNAFLNVVPEPTTAALLGLGLAVLGLQRQSQEVIQARRSNRR